MCIRDSPYTISNSGASSGNLSDQLSLSSTISSTEVKLAGLPTVTRAIQTAGGLTAKADLRRVEVRRSLPSGEAQIVQVNLWELLEQGDLNKDVVLQEGDTVVVPLAAEISDNEARKVANASFSPNFINVNVVGEVKGPGTKQLRPNVSLQQALLAAGGFNNLRANEAKVTLLRLNPDGTVQRRQIQVDFSRGLSEKDNPVLLNNDVVFVERSEFAVATDFISVFLNPFIQVFGFANLVNSLFGTSFYDTSNTTTINTGQ